MAKHIAKTMDDYPHLLKQVSKIIAPGDGMLSTGTEAHYYSVGASAVSVIRQSLDAAQINEHDIRRILDYACGFGRVLRWIKVTFPHSYILGVDANPKAVAGAHLATDVETQHLDIKLESVISEPFDLIWVGSLLTHLPIQETTRVIHFLKKHLNHNGVIVFTTHGSLVEKRLISGERSYNLDVKEISTLINMLKTEKYGYLDYPNMTGYGISVAYTSKINEIIESCGMTPVFFKSSGWANHQDVFACQFNNE